MKLPSEIRFTNKNLKDAFYRLEFGDDSERILFNELYKSFQKIKSNAFSGIIIPKRLIPKEYKADNLWKYNLPNGWRLIYSIESDKIIVVSIILEWMNHKDYEKRFKY